MQENRTPYYPKAQLWWKERHKGRTKTYFSCACFLSPSILSLPPSLSPFIPSFLPVFLFLLGWG